MGGSFVALAVALAVSANTTDEARRVAAKIDEFLARGYARARVKPAPLSGDAEFFRRLWLDVGGRIPSASEARRFLADRSPEKRARAVERVLDSVAYINHATRTWADLLVPEARADAQKRFLIVSMSNWLRKRLGANVSYGLMVRELLTMPMPTRRGNEIYQGAYGGAGEATPAAFYLGKEGKPDELAASVSRLFLGVRLECAQCHDHPYGKWKREQFWSQAAFFAGIKGGGENVFNSRLTETHDRRELVVPNTDRVAQARFLDGKAPRWKFKVGARAALAEWMTRKDNPFFARALVNRMWANYFGVGLVDPVDDIVEENPASHPELLAYLAKEFADHDHDLKFLIKAIVLSRAYQLSSRLPAGVAPGDVRLFARMPIKGLTAEQLYDSLNMATGNRGPLTPQRRAFDFEPTRQEFLGLFGEQERKTEYHTAIPQALTMMNSRLVADATDPKRGKLLGAVIEAPFLDAKGKVEALYLAVLSRKPTAAEMARCLAHLKKHGPKAHLARGLSDVYWALLNSTEFRFNH